MRGKQRATHAPNSRFGAGRRARARLCLAADALGSRGRPDPARPAPCGERCAGRAAERARTPTRTCGTTGPIRALLRPRRSRNRPWSRQEPLVGPSMALGSARGRSSTRRSLSAAQKVGLAIPEAPGPTRWPPRRSLGSQFRIWCKSNASQPSRQSTPSGVAAGCASSRREGHRRGSIGNGANTHDSLLGRVQGLEAVSETPLVVQKVVCGTGQRSRPCSRESHTGIFKPAGNQCQIGDQASLASRRPTRVLYRGFEAPRSD